MKPWKKLLGIFVSGTVLITGGILPQKNAAVAEGLADYGISSPRIENRVTTWDKNAEENSSALKVSSVTFEYMDDPYAGESYSYPIVSMQWNAGWSGSFGMISRENYNFYWRDVETEKILTDTDVFEKGKEYSLSLELPCEFDQNDWIDKEEYRHYIYEEDFEGTIDDVKFTNEDYTVEDNKIIIKDIYSKICIDRPEDKIRIHSIDFKNINTKLYEGQDTNTLHAWEGYEQTPVYINGNQKVEEGSVPDKSLHWSLWWVKLDYDVVTDRFTLAPPTDTSPYWWQLDFKEVEPNTYYGLVMILRWEQHKNGPEIAVDADMLRGRNFKFIPMVNGEGIVQNCESTFFGDVWGGLDDENDPDSVFVGYSLMAGVFSITKSLPADANVQPVETNAPTATVTLETTSTPSPKPSASVSPAPIQPTTTPTPVPSDNIGSDSTATPSNSPDVNVSANPSQTIMPDNSCINIPTPTFKAVTAPTVSKVKSLKATAGKRKLTVTWKKVSGATGYQIQVGANKSFKSAKTKTISKFKEKYVVKKLKARKKYYIRIRSYKTYTDSNARKQKVYGKWVKISMRTK